jgi:signal transduction histidine kinase
VVIIPKDLLVDNPSDFAALIKLASVSQHYLALRERIQEIFTKSIETATEKIRKLRNLCTSLQPASYLNKL